MIDISTIVARIRAQIESRVDRTDRSERAAFLRAQLEEVVARKRLQKFARGREARRNEGLYSCTRSGNQYLIETLDDRAMVVIDPGKGI